MKRIFAASALYLLFRAGTAPAGDAPAVLVPSPFSVTHQLVRTDADGSEFRAAPVTDNYGGSYLVSVRPGGSRVIVDFARRETTEVNVEKSTYWSLSFSKMSDLARRLAKAGGGPPRPSVRSPLAAPAIRVETGEASGRGRLPTSASPQGTGSAPLRRYRAWVEGGPEAEIWVDGSVTLGAAALDALENFEREALGAETAVSADGTTPSALVAAARRAAGGALPLRVRRTDAAGGSSEDVVSAVVLLPTLPPPLLAVGEGFRRVPSPLEAMVAFAEEEAALSAPRSPK